MHALGQGGGGGMTTSINCIASARGGWRSRALLTSATGFADVSSLCGGRGAGGDWGAGSHGVCVGVPREESEWGPLYSPSPPRVFTVYF